ncbi:MAG TPA: hypothetical protein VFL82_04945 [Thermomicrobiales bacterium]|jgi:hypothetical protein|nr:hypothetical protein [Thermomicrobiales bacterium]
MNLKSNIFAIAAAGLLSIGAASGMALADTTSAPSVTITLNGGTTTCSASLKNASLGTYNFLNGQYHQDATDPGTLTIDVGVSEAFGATGDTCDVSASIGALVTPSYNYLSSTVINLDSVNTGANFNSPHPLSQDSTNPSQLATGLANGGEYSWTVQDLSSQLNAHQQTPGVYSGTLTLTGHVTGTP